MKKLFVGILIMIAVLIGHSDGNSFTQKETCDYRCHEVYIRCSKNGNDSVCDECMKQYKYCRTLCNNEDNSDDSYLYDGTRSPRSSSGSGSGDDWYYNSGPSNNNIYSNPYKTTPSYKPYTYKKPKKKLTYSQKERARKERIQAVIWKSQRDRERREAWKARGGWKQNCFISTITE